MDRNKSMQYKVKEEVALRKREKEEDMKQGKRDKAEKEQRSKKIRSHVSFDYLKKNRLRGRGPGIVGWRTSKKS